MHINRFAKLMIYACVWNIAHGLPKIENHYYFMTTH